MTFAPVRQIAISGHEPEDVDDRHGDERPAKSFGGQRSQHFADDFDADDFVTMRGCRQPEHRPILAAMDDPQRDSDLRTGDQPGDRQAQLA